MKPSEQKSPKQAPPKKIAVPAREKLADLTHAQLVALRDSLRGQPRAVVDKAYRRAVRKLERATRSKPVKKAKAPTKEDAPVRKAA